MRITVIDSSTKPFFEPGTAKLTYYGEWVLKTTAWYLDRFPFMLEVEGHTQKGAETASTDDGADQSWDLSTNRAVAARTVLQNAGLEPERFWRVIGYSDRIPLEGVKPEAEETGASPSSRGSNPTRPKTSTRRPPMKSPHFPASTRLFSNRRRAISRSA